jgi:hypothetical protein
VDGSAVIARGETSKVLQLIEAALDAVSLAVEHLVVAYGSLAGTVRREALLS